MKTRILLFAVLLIAADSPNRDKERIQGGWYIHAYTGDGNKFEYFSAENPDYEFKGDEVILYGQGGSRYWVGPAKKPNKIDITPGPLFFKAGKTALGIYKIEGKPKTDDETLTICEADDGEPRPTDFTSTKGSKQRLTVFKRKPRPPAMDDMGKRLPP